MTPEHFAHFGLFYRTSGMSVEHTPSEYQAIMLSTTLCQDKRLSFASPARLK